VFDGGDCCGSTCLNSTYECDSYDGNSDASWAACNSDCLDPNANDDCCVDENCNFTGGDPVCEEIYACNFGDVGDCTFAEDGYDCDGNFLCSPGDVNADAEVNVLDIVAVVGYILYGGDDFAVNCADVTGDGAINVLDIVAIVGTILDGRTVELQ
jgi:hypothetical protein